MGTVLHLREDAHDMSETRCLRLARLNRDRAHFFREAAAMLGHGPTVWTSDEYICELFAKTVRGFREGCERGACAMPNRWKLNYIVLRLLEVSEAVGPEIAEMLIECEVKWYVDHGLRSLYDYELRARHHA